MNEELTLFLFFPPSLFLCSSIKTKSAGPTLICTGDWASRAGLRCAFRSWGLAGERKIEETSERDLGKDGEKNKTHSSPSLFSSNKKIQLSNKVLYVGDHIYGDILRSKKTLGWRTMLVVPELEAELDILSKQADTAAEMRALRAARDALEDQIQRLEWALEHPGSSSGGTATMTGDDDDGGGAPGDRGPAGAIIDSLKLQRNAVRDKHRALLKQHHEAFHAVWGRLLKAGYQNSRYAHQVQRFACLYSSHVSNLAFYSPEKSWRATPDAMAHEDPQLLAGARARSSSRAAAAAAALAVGMTDEGASSSEIA